MSQSLFKAFWGFPDHITVPFQTLSESNTKYNHGNNSTLQVDIFCSWVTVPEAQNIKEGTNLSQGVRGFSPSLANSNMEA